MKDLQQVKNDDSFENTRIIGRRFSSFKPFEKGKVVIGGYFGDEGKGKFVDIAAQNYKQSGYKLLSVRGQGSGNAGHTVVDENGKKYHFHYLTSAGLTSDMMLLGPGMLIDPIRILSEIEQLPENQRKKIFIAERAEMVCDVERAMDTWCEAKRARTGQKKIGTTKSGVGPGVGNRGYRFHITFADIRSATPQKIVEMVYNNPLYPAEVLNEVLTKEKYLEELSEAINKLQIVRSEDIVKKCREEGNWAVLLEVSQAVCLDPLFGNGGHFCTSTPCTDVGGICGSGLTIHDFSDGTTMVLKAYGSKVGGGPYITKFSKEEEEIDKFIDNLVGEHGVTTGRKRDLGWFDGPAVRHSINLTGPKDICINCMDVIGKLKKVTDSIKICYAYRNKKTNEIEYGWPYNLDEYEPLYFTFSIAGKSEKQIIAEYIFAIEEVIGQKVTGYGVGPKRTDYRERIQSYIDYIKEKHEGQFRKHGTPYSSHPIAVSNILAQKGFSEKYQIVGLLHDLLEDTNAKYEDILNISGEEIAHSVKLLTKEPGYKMEEYIQRINENELAKMVKLADRIHNLSESNYASLEFRKKYLAETKKWYLDMSKNTVFEDDLKNALEDVIKTLTS